MKVEFKCEAGCFLFVFGLVAISISIWFYMRLGDSLELLKNFSYLASWDLELTREVIRQQLIISITMTIVGVITILLSLFIIKRNLPSEIMKKAIREKNYLVSQPKSVKEIKYPKSEEKRKTSESENERLKESS